MFVAVGSAIQTESTQINFYIFFHLNKQKSIEIEMIYWNKFKEKTRITDKKY